MSTKKTRGRQKLEMVKMENMSNLQVTFSKRRSGLFKKANELCTLCGAEVVIIVFSPGGKAFSFGHPSVNTLIDRVLGFIPPTPVMNSGTRQIAEAYQNMTVCGMSTKLTRILEVVQTEKKRGSEMERSRMERLRHCWWEGPTEDMETQKLELLASALNELKFMVNNQQTEMLLAAQSAKLANTQFFVGSSSTGGGPSSHQDLPNIPTFNNFGFNYGNGNILQGPNDGNNIGFNENPIAVPFNGGWNPNLGGGFF